MVRAAGLYTPFVWNVCLARLPGDTDFNVDTACFVRDEELFTRAMTAYDVEAQTQKVSTVPAASSKGAAPRGGGKGRSFLHMPACPMTCCAALAQVAARARATRAEIAGPFKVAPPGIRGVVQAVMAARNAMLATHGGSIATRSNAIRERKSFVCAPQPGIGLHCVFAGVLKPGSMRALGPRSSLGWQRQVRPVSLGCSCAARHCPCCCRCCRCSIRGPNQSESTG